MQKFKSLFKLTILILIIVLTSCEDNMKNCIEGVTDEGYSYDEALEKCEQARDDSYIQ